MISDPLLAAVDRSDLPAVLELLEAGHSPDVGDEVHGTPLTLSLMHREAEILDALLEAGASPDFAAPGLDPPLIAAIMDMNQPAVAKLLAAGADPNGEGDPLSLAVAFESEAIVKQLLASGADPRTSLSIVQVDTYCKPVIRKLIETVCASRGSDTLEAAVRLDQPEGIPTLIQTASREDRDAAWALALAEGKLEAVMALAPAFDLDALSVNLVRPLHMAVRSNVLEVVQFLLEAGADPNTTIDEGPRSTGVTPLMVCCSQPVAAALVAAGADPARTDGQGETALSRIRFWEMRYQDGPIQVTLKKLVRYLETLPNNDGEADIFRACRDGLLDRLRALVDGGADLEATSADHHGETPLAIALGRGQTEAARILLDGGASTHDPVLWRRALPAKLPGVRMLIEAGADVNADILDGMTPLLFAARWADKLDVIEALLAAGADPGAEVDGKGLLELAKKNRRKVFLGVRDLLAADAEPYDLADAALVSLKTSGSSKKMKTLAKEIAADLGSRARAWRKRAGVKAITAPEDADIAPLQAKARAQGALLIYNDSSDDARQQMRLLFFPIDDWIAVLRVVGTNGHNYGLTTRKLVEWLVDLRARHPFELVGAAHDLAILQFTDPPEDDASLIAGARQMCPDLEQDTLLEGSLTLWWD